MTVLATDTFNRANDASIGTGASWARSDGDNIPIISNQAGKASGGTGYALFYNTAATWPNNHWSQLTIKILANATDEGMGPSVRMQATGGAGNAYFVQASTTETRLYKKIAGAFTQLGSDAAACAVNDVLYIEVQGTTIVVKINGTTVITVTDASISSGNAGIWSSEGGTAADAIDDWSGGDFSGGAVTDDDAGWMPKAWQPDPVVSVW